MHGAYNAVKPFRCLPFSKDMAGWLRHRVADRQNPLLGEGGVDATSRKISRSHLVGSGRGGSFNYRLIGGLNQPLLMLRAIALALRARLRELMCFATSS